MSVKASRHTIGLFLLLALGITPAALAQQVTVDSATPSSTEQGTQQLPITIKGRGFRAGAQAEFLVTGTANPGGITVASTGYVNSTTLVATIDVADDALLANFDIYVYSNGRTGKGIEKFTVIPKGSNPSQNLPVEFRFPFSGTLAPDGNLMLAILTGDEVQADGSFTIYQHQNGDYPGVDALMWGPAGPKLILDDPERYLIVRFEDSDRDPSSSCAVSGLTFYVNGDGLWFTDLANQPEWRDPDNPGAVDPNYQKIDGGFLGMTAGIDEGYARMIFRFILTESRTTYLWRAIFGDYPDASNPAIEKSRVRVQVTDRDAFGNPLAWRIRGLENDRSTARVGSKTIKGKTVEYDWGFCQTWIDFDIRLAQ